MDGFRADPADLTSGAKDILKRLEPAEDIDFDELTRDLGAFGHSGHSGAFAQFCSTWQIAYLLLGSRASDAADILTGIAGNYGQSDDDAGQLLNPLGQGLDSAIGGLGMGMAPDPGFSGGLGSAIGGLGMGTVPDPGFSGGPDAFAGVSAEGTATADPGFDIGKAAGTGMPLGIVPDPGFSNPGFDIGEAIGTGMGTGTVPDPGFSSDLGEGFGTGQAQGL